MDHKFSLLPPASLEFQFLSESATNHNEVSTSYYMIDAYAFQMITTSQDILESSHSEFQTLSAWGHCRALTHKSKHCSIIRSREGNLDNININVKTNIKIIIININYIGSIVSLAFMRLDRVTSLPLYPPGSRP